MRKIRTIVLGLIVITCLTQCKSTQEKELKPQLDSYFEQQVFNKSGDLNEKNKPGLSVVITKKDSVIYKGSFGLANLEDKSPITETTTFDIASVTKQFTGMAIALLEEKGEINMNDKIVQYLPDLPTVMKDITVYQLVHHTSGIRDWPTLFALKGWQPETALSLDDIYEMLKKQDHLNFTPGTQFSYSNSNYNLLVKIIEVVTDTTFNSWMHDYIFAPLEMNSTYFAENSNQKADDFADSYVYNGNDYLLFSNKLNAPGSSSLRSNASDMSKWMMNFHSKSLGGNTVFNKMTEKGSLADNETIAYGYGLYITEIEGKQAYGHDGAWGGYRLVTAFFPEESIGVVILSNDGTIQTKNIMRDVFDILFGNEEEKEEKSKETKVVEQEINDDFFSLCAGKYEQVDDKGCYLSFYKDAEEYFLNMYNKDYKLYAKSDTVFFVKEAEAEFVFHLRNGEVNSHTLKQNGNSYLALRLDENKQEVNIDYDKLTGVFYSNELDVNYEIRYEKDELIIFSTVLSEEITLEHLEYLTFKSNSSLIQSLSFLEENGVIVSIVINNSRANNLLFKKLN
jgi:CubicO group peptidase (beta-lactamase class C family)